MTTGRIAARLDDIERRLDALERHIAALEQVSAEVRRLERVAGDLKFELEQMQEA